MPARTRLSVTALALSSVALAQGVVWTVPASVFRRIAMKTASGVKPQTKADPDALARIMSGRVTRIGEGSDAPVPPAPTTPLKPVVAGRTTAPRPHSVEKWIKSMVTDRVEVTGNRTIGYHAQSVDGDRSAYDLLTNYGQGAKSVTNNGQMNVQGKKVLGFLDFQLAVTDDRIQDPYNQRTTLSYARGPLSVTYGDVRADLTNTNQFARFSRQLNGTAFGWKSGRMEFKAVHSVSRGSARTVSIEGNNSAGPYYLQSGHILADSLAVRLDGQDLRLGEDYVLDTDLGAITFVNRTISPTSTILVTYESQGFNDATGTLQGGGFAYDFGRIGRLGLTMIEQRGLGDPSNRTLFEYFQGYNDANVPYILQYPPVPGTVRLFIDNVEQPPTVYRSSANNPNIIYIFGVATPSTSTVSINYRPQASVTVVGDRRTMGADWRLPFGKTGKSGFLQLDYADGRSLGSDGTGGIAKGMTVDYRHGDLHMTTGLRDVPATFVTVESRGFNRNERAWNMNLDYGRGRFTYGFDHQNSAINVLGSDGSIQASRSVSTSASMRYGDPSGTRWSLQQTHALGNQLGETRLDTSSLSASKTLAGGRFDLNMGLDYQMGRGPMSDGTTVRTGDVRLATARTGFDWRLGNGLTANGKLGFSRVSSLTGDGNGRDTSLGLAYRPNERWTISANRIDSDSGQAATLSGFGAGYGYGYGGNGFSSGSIGSLASFGATSIQDTQLATDFRATSRLSLTARMYQTRSSGDLSSNSDTAGYGVAMNMDLGGYNNLTLSLDRSRTNFLGTTIGGDSSLLSLSGNEATSYSFSLSGAPKGRINYGLSTSGLLSRGSLGFSGSDSLLFDASLGYRLNDRQRLSFGFTRGRTSGLYGQNESYASAAYEYRLWGNVGLRGIYRWRDVSTLDAASALGSYRSRGLDVELSFDFGH